MTLESIAVLVVVLFNLAQLLLILIQLLQRVYAFGCQTGLWRRLQRRTQTRRKRTSRRPARLN